MAFELASTNLVIELGIILFVILGWQFTLAEYFSGIVMVILIALIFRLTLTPKLVEMARANAHKGLLGRMEGHTAMDMSLSDSSFFSKLVSNELEFLCISLFGYGTLGSITLPVFRGSYRVRSTQQ
jgi:uncharacterized membrane protein YraQ (UPF0718 family)